ncbi:MAG: AMP-binding protein [Brucellaceae bacterium]|nr:AMP-binding protein [Brucellaceae bacterium]
MNPAEWLARSALLRPDAPALLRGATQVADYREFARRAAVLGAALRDVPGVEKGGRIAIFMSNRTEYLEVLFGAWYAGATVVPVNAKLHAREAAWIIENSGATVAFAAGTQAAALAEVAPACLAELIDVNGPAYEGLFAASPLAAPAELAPNDVAWLFYTSGTTGRPKGVMITARNLVSMTLAYFANVDTVHPEDAALYAAPMSHGAGLYCLMHVLKGARHVVPESGGFEAAEIAELAPVIGNVSMFAAPTMVSRLVDHAKRSGWAGDGIRTIVYGGGPMYVADILEAVEVMGPRFVQIYGQGESPMTITALSRELVAERTHPRWRERLGSVGTAQSPVLVRVADADGNELPRGEPGEILVSGDAVMRGYWQDPDATAATLRDGWLWTGDIGVMDGDGFLTLQDRSKDVIISGGTNIYPREVEEALLTHADVSEVAVVGRKHPEWGEEVVAFVVPREGVALDVAALDAHCLGTIARFKRPKHYFSIENLPKNNYGKVLKTELRQRMETEGDGQVS